MAVDTASKRSAALRFGMSRMSGTRPPSGSIPAFERAALLACYYTEPLPVTFGTPQCGWTFSTEGTVWAFSPEETVWTFGDC
jgi:hypothetical protein